MQELNKELLEALKDMTEKVEYFIDQLPDSAPDKYSGINKAKQVIDKATG
ncbi:MAG: hypothetical protein IIB17_10090 [Chloroflexi bacterium]|nr:hypothetical protein [Chloroflexota bacterium]